VGSWLANPIAAAAPALAEPLTLAVMVVCFGALAIKARWPIGVALAVGAWGGAALNGHYLPLRHLVEGAFSYLDPILVIATAMIFMRVLADGGALASVGRVVERSFGTRPVLLLPVLMVIVMFPGMMTGSSTASVLTTGAMAASIAVGLGLSRERAAAFVAMGSILGMVAPPVNIPAMLIGGGIDLPFVGFAAPLAVLAFPLAIALAYWFGWPLIVGSAARSSRAQSANVAQNTSPNVPQASNVAQDFSPALPLWRALAPPLVAVVMMTAPRLWPLAVPDPGLPVVFLVSAAVGVMCSARFRIGQTLVVAMDEALPVLGILVGVGAFIQVMTLTGGRGWLVAQMLAAPPWALVLAAAVSMPLFGAISAFGSASVLGVPFLLAFLGRNEVVTTAALSLLASLGDLMLPAALAATLAARVAGVEDRRRVLSLCVLPATLAVAMAVCALLFAPALGRLVM
jgi:TRAP-type C4-dicarboxylate transport system permease large subunit